MTFYRLVFIFGLIAYGGITVSAQYIQRCKMNDNDCITISAKKLYLQVMDGIPPLGIEPLDPMFVEYIKGDLQILDYKITNSTIEGARSCTINKIKSNFDQMSMHVDMTCYKLVWTGGYEIFGNLLFLHVEGTGNYTIVTEKYNIRSDLNLHKVKGKDGQEHLAIKNFKLTVKALAPIHFRMDNLFNGEKALSDTVHNFANKNWDIVSNVLQDPVFYGVFNKIVGIINKILETETIDSLFLTN